MNRLPKQMRYQAALLPDTGFPTVSPFRWQRDSEHRGNTRHITAHWRRNRRHTMLAAMPTPTARARALSAMPAMQNQAIHG
jgi:hypothetical protein